MRKRAYFDEYWGPGWPDPKSIEHFFIGKQQQPWLPGNDGAVLTAEGVDGTEHLESNRGRMDIRLYITGHPARGVTLCYQKWGGGFHDTYYSKGDLSRVREVVRSMHGTPDLMGLFIPFEQAWLAVKEFIEMDGALPKSIEWIASRDLPPNSFPDH
jgi:hypothetical protein